MGREIKFRFYHKELKVMHEVVEYNFRSKFASVEGYPYALDLSGVELMQYTGLKDKNGTEIYEGDIVKTVFGNPHWEEKVKEEIDVVIFCRGEFKTKLFELNLSGFGRFINTYEVIGNEYENPELLEGG